MTSRDGEGIAPPHDLDAEAAVISAVLLDPLALPKVQDFLRPEHFYSEANRRIYEAAIAIALASQPIDPMTVGGWLKDHGRFAQVGGSVYLQQVMDASPAVANVRAHAVLVHDDWRRRQVIVNCQKASAAAYTGGAGDVQAFCDATVRTLAVIAGQNPLRPVENNREALDRLLRQAMGDNANATLAGQAPGPGIPTGIHSLDQKIHGLRRKAKTTIAATTGVGKTALALRAARHAAACGVSVLMFTTGEVTRDECMLRLAAAETGIDANRIRLGPRHERPLVENEIVRLFEAANLLNALPLRIDETPRLGVDQIRSTAKSFAEESFTLFRQPLGLVIVDYVQRLQCPSHLTRKEKPEWIGHNSRELKLLAQELAVAVLELAQAKEPDPRNRKAKPTALGSIADSSQIGKEADETIFLLDQSDDPQALTRTIEAYMPKVRGGAKNQSVWLEYEGPFYRFRDPNAPGTYSSPSRQYVDREHAQEDD